MQIHEEELERREGIQEIKELISPLWSEEPRARTAPGQSRHRDDFLSSGTPALMVTSSRSTEIEKMAEDEIIHYLDTLDRKNPPRKAPPRDGARSSALSSP